MKHQQDDNEEIGERELSVTMAIEDWDTLLDAFVAANNVMVQHDEGGSLAMRVCARMLWNALARAGVVMVNPMHRMALEPVCTCGSDEVDHG